MAAFHSSREGNNRREPTLNRKHEVRFIRRTDGSIIWAARAIGLAGKTRECELGFNRSGYKWDHWAFMFNSVTDEDAPTGVYKNLLCTHCHLALWKQDFRSGRSWD